MNENKFKYNGVELIKRRLCCKKQIEEIEKNKIKFRGIETYWGKDKMFNPDEWTNEAFKIKE